MYGKSTEKNGYMYMLHMIWNHLKDVITWTVIIYSLPMYLKTWTDHGELLNSDDVKKQTGIGIDGFMWAPDCAYNPKDKTYYFYFPHKIQKKENGTGQDIWRIFVATSKDPAADFKVKGFIEGIPSTIDPCVFVDDDGQPYIYTSGAGKGGWGCKLKKDDWSKPRRRNETYERICRFSRSAMGI